MLRRGHRAELDARFAEQDKGRLNQRQKTAAARALARKLADELDQKAKRYG